MRAVRRRTRRVRLSTAVHAPSPCPDIHIAQEAAESAGEEEAGGAQAGICIGPEEAGRPSEPPRRGSRAAAAAARVVGVGARAGCESICV